MSGEIRIAGVPVALNPHRRARRFILRVSRLDGRVTLTVPASARRDAARRFLEQHRDWIVQRAGKAPAPVPFEDGALVPLRGVGHRIVIRPGGVCVRAGILSGGDAAAIASWLRQQARADLAARSFAHADALGVHPRQIVIRDQKTRWGSCSANGTLSYSWRLVLSPPAVLDYLAAHEVAHLREMNHGPAFWALVARLRPDYDEQRQWLRAHGPGLHRYGWHRP